MSQYLPKGYQFCKKAERICAGRRSRCKLKVFLSVLTVYFDHKRMFLTFSALMQACSVCKLRLSCDKAYVIPNAEEAARTVDVVRILLTYAIDPAGLSGEDPVAGGVQESARKLLSDLTMLCDTTIDPSLPKPVFQTASKKESSTKVGKVTQSHAKSRVSAGNGRETAVTEMKKGDWLCPK
jgi:hypothetical protein